MVDIRDFFGTPGKKGGVSKKSGPKTTTTKNAGKPRKTSEVENDDLIELPPSKKLKKEETKATKSEYFNGGTKSSPKKKRETIDLDFDDDDDFEFDDDDNDDDEEHEDNPQDDDFGDDDDIEILEHIKPATKTRASPRKTPVPSTIEPKVSPKKTPKKPKVEIPTQQEVPKVIKKSPAKVAPPKKIPTSSSQSQTGITAIDVLSKIPDTELPEDIPTGEGFNFRDFKARQSELPVQSGTVEIPEGAPNCLTGLTMVFTGVLPNITRDDAENLAKKYGAKVTKSISSKTSVVVLGEEAGPSKVRKIKQFKIKAISEDGFLQLIKGMPEEGGDGVDAEKARIRRQQEEQKALEESVKMQEEAEAEAKKREAAVKKAQKSGNFANASQLKTDDEKLWTVKYAPTNIDQICGNKSSVQRLKQWLESWHYKFGTRKPVKGETEMRAVLIHGPPGIGKTTAAHLIAKFLGFDVLEKNASDVRSKGLLNGTVATVLNNTSVVGFFNKSEDDLTNNGNKFCIIMDEVDGMSGGDRGGVGQLASFCRTTQAPLILICNDKTLPKMRPFDRVTLDIPFRRPSAREMKSRLMTIALREHIKLDPNIIDQLVAATNNDIRQIINLLSTVSKTQSTIDTSNSKTISSQWQKNTSLKIFDIIPRLLSGQIYHENSNVPLFKKMEYYFDDHAFVPLMLQENYLNTRPAKGATKLAHLELAAKSADSISEGDLVDAKIHSADQQWSLMPLHAIISTVRPASFVAGQLSGRVNFSAWLGQNSKTGKYYRLLTELQYRSRLRTSTDQTELRLEYIPVLAKKLLRPLVESADNIPEIIEILDNYYLSKTDWDFLMEFPIGEEATAPILKKIPAGTKSKFTRKYNSGSHPVSVFRPGLSTGVGGKPKKEVPDIDDVLEDEPEEDIGDDE